MNYLELVQESMKRAGVRTAAPDTLVGAVDVAQAFAWYVNDSWRELQEESFNWWFRQKLDQTLAISSGVDEYAMPTGLQSLNYDTCTIYLTAKTDETPVSLLPYRNWRTVKDTVDTAESRPTRITERPDGVLQVWPVPDQDYTLRFDGVWDIDNMSNDTDEPGSTISGGLLLPARHHYILVYDAARRHHEHNENAEGVHEMQRKFLKMHRRLAEVEAPPVYVKPGVLTGLRTASWRRT